MRIDDFEVCIEWLVHYLVNSPPFVEDFSYHAHRLTEIGEILCDCDAISYDENIVRIELEEYLRFGGGSQTTKMMNSLVPEISIQIATLLYTGQELRLDTFVKVLITTTKLSRMIKVTQTQFGLSLVGRPELLDSHGVEIDVFHARSAHKLLGLPD